MTKINLILFLVLSNPSLWLFWYILFKIELGIGNQLVILNLDHEFM